MVDILHTGLTGLMASQRSLATTGHNIANANTPHYSRQRVDLISNPPLSIGGTNSARSGAIGTGVDIAGIGRVYDDFLTQQVRNHDNSVNQLQTLDGLTKQVNSLLGNSNSGLAPALQQFFAAVQDVADTPDSVPARQAMLGQAETLAARFRDVNQQLSGLHEGVNQGLRDTVSQINVLADAIAEINQKVVLAQGSAGAAPSDLLDQRDKLLADLSSQVAVQTVPLSDGGLNVFIGAGQTLVLGSQASHLDTAVSDFDPQKLQIRYQGKGSDITGQLQGGKLGGYLAFQNQVLEPARDGIGFLALGLANTFNELHHQGLDLNGSLGGDFFHSGSPQVFANAFNGGNASITVTVTDSEQLQRSNYEVKYDGSNYSLLRLADDKVLASNATGSFSVDGLDITTGGSASQGDRFLVLPTRNAAYGFSVDITDPSAIAAAAPISSSSSLTNQGWATIAAAKVIDAADPNLRQAVEIRFTSASTFDIIDTTTSNTLVSSQTYSSGAPISFNGWEVDIGGTVVAGDSFQVLSNTGGVGDNRNALALAGLQASPELLGGTTNYQGVYAQIVAEVGTQGSRTKSNLQAQQALLEQAQQARDAVSGVNLDEEAADLLRFQRTYEAAAQVIRVADSLFSTLLDAVRS